MSDTLQRFHEAQATGFSEALAEMQSGQKRSHWIWYIFPQIAGLGNSHTARFYALHDLDEARSYLSDPVLFANYRKITQVLADRLNEGAALPDLMGSEIDALKLVSSLTLFRHAAAGLHEELSRFCDGVLEMAAKQGYPACQFTLDRVTME